MRPGLDRHLGRAQTLFDEAEDRCARAKRGPAKRSLRLVRRRLGRVGKALQRRLARRTVASTVTAPIARRAVALAADVRVLSTTLGCR
jgi:hypothetical protein